MGIVSLFGDCLVLWVRRVVGLTGDSLFAVFNKRSGCFSISIYFIEL